MKYSQNEKLNPVDFNTMVVGVNVGSELHNEKAFDYRGTELSGILKISNAAVGFKAFRRWTHELMKKHNKSRIILGKEPTVRYWFNFGYGCKKKEQE